MPGLVSVQGAVPLRVVSDEASPTYRTGLQFPNPVSSSEIASLKGHKAKTPIIAGSICGGVMGIAWIIGFSIYFYKRYRHKERKSAIAAGKAPADSLPPKIPPEKVIIPPDPAVLLGQHHPGERIYENGNAQPIAHLGTHDVSSKRTSMQGRMPADASSPRPATMSSRVSTEIMTIPAHTPT